MKIVCEACQAKYSISDDKVRGKVFKIRCKKCSHVIVVKGTGDSADAAGEFSAAPLTGSAMDAVADGAAWHVVINGDQVGPLADSDVRARMSRGELAADSFIWKEGFSDWVKISSLGEFADMAAPAAAPPASEPYGGSFASSNDVGVSFASSGPEPATYVSPQSGDPFAGLGGGGMAAAPSADPFAHAAGGMPDLFSAPMGGAEAQGGGGFGGFDGGAKPSNGAGSAALTGQRHENSVLFSLSNLESLAKPSAPISSSAPRPGASPSPIGDGSGLIDIRAMAAVVTGGSASPSPFSSSPGGSDLPSFAAPQFSPIAPVMLPVAHSSGPSKGVVALLAVMGVLIVVATAVIWKVMTKPVAAPVVAALPVAEPTPPPVAAVVAPEPVVPPPSAAPPADEKLPPREDSKPVAAAKPEKGGGRSSAKKSNKPDPTPAEKPVAAAPAPVEKPTPAKAEPEKRKPSDSIDDLLAAASGGTKKPAPVAKREDDEPAPKKEAAPGSDKELNRQDIVKAMTPVVGKARDCYAQFKVPGMVDLKLVVAPSGKVSPTVTGKFAGTPSGDCVEGAAKNARFPASAGGNFTYPVSLR